MGWGANTYLRATKEATYGVFNPSETINVLWFRLVGDTAFDTIPEVQRKELMSADGGNRPVQNISSRVTIPGKLRTPLYPTQTSKILAMATDISSGDLASWTFDYFDSFEIVRLLGGKVGGLDLSCSAESDEGIVMLDMDLVFQKPGSLGSFSAPSNTLFPTENPYVHKESKGGLTVGGSVRTLYNQFKMSVKNILANSFEEDTYIANSTYCGRTIDFSTSFQYVAATDRTNYEGQAAQTCSILFTKASPASTLTLDWKTQARYTSRKRSTPLGNVARQDIGLRTFLDGTADFSFATT